MQVSSTDTIAKMVQNIQSHTPFSFIRFGSNEAAILNIDPSHKTSVKSAISVIKSQSNFPYTTLSIVSIVENTISAFSNADILGICTEGKVTPSLQKSRMKFQTKCCLLTNHNFNFEIFDKLESFIGGQKCVTVISSRNISDILHRQYRVKDVRQLRIPPDHRFPSLNGDYENEFIDYKIFPTICEAIEPHLKPRYKGEVFLVGGGVFCKYLCGIIKSNGGIALDLGMVLDLIANKDPCDLKKNLKPQSKMRKFVTKIPHLIKVTHKTSLTDSIQRKDSPALSVVTSRSKSLSVKDIQDYKSLLPDKLPSHVDEKPLSIEKIKDPEPIVPLTEKERLEKISTFSLKPLTFTPDFTILIYTAVTAPTIADLRDNLEPIDPEMLRSNPHITFMCLTNLEEYDPPIGWEKMLINFKNIDKIKVAKNQRCRLLARSIKILPQLYFNIYEYNVFVWADGNVKWNLSPKIFVKELMGRKTDPSKPLFSSFYHCERQSVSEEISFICEKRPEEVFNLWGLFDHYRSQKFPDRCGLFETCIITREPDAETTKLSEIWWNTMVNYCLRDQIILPFAVWKCAEKVSVVGLRYKWRADTTAHSYLDWEMAPWVQRLPHIPM